MKMKNCQEMLRNIYVLYVIDDESYVTDDMDSVLGGANLGIEFEEDYYFLMDYNIPEILLKTDSFNEILLYLNEMTEQFVFDDGSFYDFLVYEYDLKETDFDYTINGELDTDLYYKNEHIFDILESELILKK